MKRILLHIGYPKTATTTLQEHVFVPLHILGKINYLGRTITSTHYKDSSNKFLGTDLVPDLRRSYLFGKAFEFNQSVLSNTTLNVISDEDLTFHSDLQIESLVKPKELPVTLRKFFGDNCEIKVVVTIRNQTDLIFSSFVQKYRFLYQKNGHLTFNEFWERIRKRSELFDFNETLLEYSKTFNSMPTILFFEDWINDLREVSRSWSELLHVEVGFIDRLLEGNHTRKRKGDSEYVPTNYFTLTKFGRLLCSSVRNEANCVLSLHKKHYMNFSYLKKMEEILLLKEKTCKLLVPSKQEREEIISEFSDSNLKFIENFSLDSSKMKEYGYVNHD